MTRFGMIFPGQGSQTIGMLKKLAEMYSIVKETFDEASSILQYDLWHLVQKGPVEELNKTCKTQPAILTASVSIWRIWKQQGGKNPQFMAGHSLGEYSALVCAGVIGFLDAVSLVALRGTLMQHVIPVGGAAMAAIIGLDSTIVVNICTQVEQNQVVEVSSFNAPDQVVISGHKAAVERVITICKEIGAKKIFLLPISVPSHCKLMQPVAIQLSKILKKIIFYTPRIPVINNVDADVVHCPVNIRQALVRQLYQPVRWTGILKYLMNQNIKVLLEIGPGNVLTGLTKRNIDSVFVSSINNPSTLVAYIIQ
ncbi:ACP S-malonyltransferase [Blochmannia endosymbiont of Camponotus (Colobopsis) obliquus]|uniref:ACP S-malonyltransferase n=1 Tax=Blochmannia endosymbiont of Camponotus (Colobopsis) obliquus TaxID=1505597 RepID=UPI00061A84A8|nr:ACP S-malonyltransferase [Blochmannia endosymbiont of Camponotus (Colobopsis) obliquus]AKC60564.1 malonyl CoA-acyl carrier protein transacylase [Blochmannia endosymbiont of Camponotus (Colobopsis) obliquus]